MVLTINFVGLPIALHKNEVPIALYGKKIHKIGWFLDNKNDFSDESEADDEIGKNGKKW